jgi:hypothetical protein
MGPKRDAQTEVIEALRRRVAELSADLTALIDELDARRGGGRNTGETKADAETRLQGRTKELSRKTSAMARSSSPFSGADYEILREDLALHRRALVKHRRRPDDRATPPTRRKDEKKRT